MASIGAKQYLNLKPNQEVVKMLFKEWNHRYFVEDRSEEVFSVFAGDFIEHTIYQNSAKFVVIVKEPQDDMSGVIIRLIAQDELKELKRFDNSDGFYTAPDNIELATILDNEGINFYIIRDKTAAKIPVYLPNRFGRPRDVPPGTLVVIKRLSEDIMEGHIVYIFHEGQVKTLENYRTTRNEVMNRHTWDHESENSRICSIEKIRLDMASKNYSS